MGTTSRPGTDGRGAEAMGRGIRFLRAGAFLTILVAGLKLAGGLLTPIIVAAFVTIICAPAVHLLKRLRLPSGIAVVLVLIAALGSILLVSVLVVDSASEFAANRETYEQLLEAKVRGFEEWLQRKGIELAPPQASEPLDTRRLLQMLGSAVGTVADVFSNIFLVLLIVVFMLLETSGLPAKIRRAVADPEADLANFTAVGRQVWQYLAVKTLMSVVTGLSWGAFLAVMKVEYAVLWGLLAFLLNYIPNIGSLIAMIPPVLLTLLTRDVGTAAVVVVGNVVINQVTGSLIEPRVMGARLGLSPLVVFLSLVFWSWLWGPVGMLLSVPLTMVVKILLESSEDLRFVATLLGPADEHDPRAAPG